MKNISKIRKLANEEKAVAAVEFALIAPIMILMLFGSIEVAQAVSIDRKVTQAASTIADLTAQYSSVDCATLGTLSSVTRAVFEPFASQGVSASVSIASVALVDGAPKVEWSQTVSSTGVCSTAADLPVGLAVPSALNLVGTNTGVVLGKVSLNYTSLGTSFFPNSITLSEQYLLGPRKSDKVCLSGTVTAGC